MNTPVSFEIDKLLLSKNIDMPVNPTIADVVMRLYEKHGVWIYGECDVYGNFYPKIYFSKEENWFNLERRSKMNEGNRVICRKEYKSPKEAYEAAIIYTLNNLI